MHVLLLSTYELGRQPFGLASPAAWLRDAGVRVTCVDLSRQTLADATIAGVDTVAFYLPMHTATRLALPVIERVRGLNSSAGICAFGLYARLNDALLRARGVEAVFGGEFEEELTDWIFDKDEGQRTKAERTKAESVPRLDFKVPDRTGLPPLTAYAALQTAEGTRRVVGYTEASRGCKHLCRHCPIVPIYEGRFRVVPPEVVLADVSAQVAAGAQHITFGDPDFFNGIKHAVTVVRSLAREHPGLTYDVTIKVEHLLKHADALPVLSETGCLFVTSAVESFDDRVLAALEKGHTRQDVERAVTACRRAGLTLTPTFVPFTPWTTLETYLDLLRMIAELGLVSHVAPIQLAIRLLIPNGSRLLALDDIRRVIGPFDAAALVHPWRHSDAAVDELQQKVERLVGTRLNAPRAEMFDTVWRLAHEAARVALPSPPTVIARAAVPFLTEPWYC